MSHSNEPGVYVKGDIEKVAQSPSEAVALAFKGFKRRNDVELAQPKEAVRVSTPELAPVAPKPQPPREARIKDGDQ